MSSAPHICFVSTMCLLDPVSGAAHSARNILETLAASGFKASAFTASLFDSHDEVEYATMIGKEAGAKDAAGKVARVKRNSVEHLVYLTASSRGRQITQEEKRAIVASWRAYLKGIRPDIILSYGTSSVSQAMRDAARDVGAKIVYYLGNADITDTEFVRPGDTAVCPSRHLAQLYADRLGLETAVLNPVINPANLVAEGAGIAAHPDLRRLGFVTFINPLPHKGLTLVAQLIRRALTARPDMRFLLLEGRMPRRALQELQLDLPGVRNVWWLPEQKDMAAVYARTSVLLVPSFWTEGFGRSVVEAQLSGIPVLASNRGGLVEALGGAVEPLPVDPRCIENFYAHPTPETVERWWQALVSYWDNDTVYASASQRARAAAQPYAPEQTRARVISHFRAIAGTEPKAGV